MVYFGRNRGLVCRAFKVFELKLAAEKEKKIVQALKRNDKRAQLAFWKEQHPKMVRLCFQVLQDEIGAEEIATEVLVDFIFRRVHELRHDGAAASYLKLMAVRRAVRMRDQLHRFSGELNEDVPGQEVPSILDTVEAGTLLPRLAACLEKLSAKSRKALQLRYGEEMTTERIGNLLGCSKQYVGRLIRNSLLFLRDCIERHEGAGDREKDMGGAV